MLQADTSELRFTIEGMPDGLTYFRISAANLKPQLIAVIQLAIQAGWPLALGYIANTAERSGEVLILQTPPVESLMTEWLAQ